MTWTYQDTMPHDTDKVRFYVGDTVASNPLLTDEEITFALSEGGSPRQAAAICCDRLAAKYTSLVDTTVGTLSLKHGARAQQYRDMAATLRARGAVLAMPHAGGILVDDKVTNQQDDSLVKPSFTVDQLDNAFVGGLDVTPNSTADEFA